MKYADENTFFPELCENYSPVLKADDKQQFDTRPLEFSLQK